MINATKKVTVRQVYTQFIWLLISIVLYKLGTCELAVWVRIEHEWNQKRCAELQINQTRQTIPAYDHS